MSISLPSADAEEDAVLATINTTPLVDVMLVLLIIFLITIPVVTQTVPVSLPKDSNQPRAQQAQRIEISVTRSGEVYWGLNLVQTQDELVRQLKTQAAREPQPEVSLRGDEASRFEAIDRVMQACKQAGLSKVGLVIEPPARGG